MSKKKALLECLDRLSSDYARETGQRFKHFYCPFLYVDEAADLCRGHVVNQAFRDAPKQWTVQRADLDSFYGRVFEAEFVALESARSTWTAGVLADRNLHRELRPSLIAGDEKIDYFVAHGPVPESFTQIAVDSGDGELSVLGLKVSPERFNELLDTRWNIEINRDLRVASLVSLIKAAALTKFRQHGYRYALSAAGHLVGHEILGKFFLKNRSKLNVDVRRLAREFFGEFESMVRPVIDCPDMRSTVEDRRVHVCWGASNRPWATIVFVRTGNLTNAVMMPISDRPDAIATYLEFLKNDNEMIVVREAIFSTGDGESGWKVSPTGHPVRWPKGDSWREGHCA